MRGLRAAWARLRRHVITDDQYADLKERGWIIAERSSHE
jgi:hypothetical protein